MNRQVQRTAREYPPVAVRRDRNSSLTAEVILQVGILVAVLLTLLHRQFSEYLRYILSGRVLRQLLPNLPTQIPQLSIRELSKLLLYLQVSRQGDSPGLHR